MTDWQTTTRRLLNAIFNGCDAYDIKLFSSYETTKDAWDILQTTFESSGDMKRNKLHLSLTTRFENLRILYDESLFDFHTKLCDISNESFAFGEKIPENTLVKKIIRSLMDLDSM